MKCIGTKENGKAELSRPARGAWIEIEIKTSKILLLLSRPARGAWIEIVVKIRRVHGFRKSRPARGAWIEMKRHRTYLLHT